jgi:hypothetical protein
VLAEPKTNAVEGRPKDDLRSRVRPAISPHDAPGGPGNSPEAEPDDLAWSPAHHRSAMRHIPPSLRGFAQVYGFRRSSLRRSDFLRGVRDSDCG